MLFGSSINHPYLLRGRKIPERIAITTRYRLTPCWKRLAQAIRQSRMI